MKKIAIIIALLLMVAGGGVGGLKFMQMGPFALSEEELALRAAGGGAKDIGGLFKAKPTYIDMPALMIPIFDDSDMIGTIQISYKLEVYGKKNEKALVKLQTKVNDALIRDFTYYIPRTLRRNQNLDVALIKYRIMLVLNRELGEGVVSEALIQSMNQIARDG